MEQRKVVSAGIRSAVACWQAPGSEFWQCYFLGLEICRLVHSDALKSAHRYCPFCTLSAKIEMEYCIWYLLLSARICCRIAGKQAGSEKGKSF